MKKYLKISVEDLPWQKVVEALNKGFHNIPSQEQAPGGKLEGFLDGQGLRGKPLLFVATHSEGGRKLRLLEDRNPSFYKEAGNDGWHAVAEEDVELVELVSASSGSVLRAERSGSQWERGNWTVSLEVPIQGNGEPYQGLYWESFHQALGGLE